MCRFARCVHRCVAFPCCIELTEVGCQAVNLGTGKGFSVFDVVKGMEAASGKKIPYKVGLLTWHRCVVLRQLSLAMSPQSFNFHTRVMPGAAFILGRTSEVLHSTSIRSTRIARLLLHSSQWLHETPFHLQCVEMHGGDSLSSFLDKFSLPCAFLLVYM